MGVALSDGDRLAIEGGRGKGHQLAMELVIKLAEVSGATRLIDITGAHIDGCLFHGQAGLDFVRRLSIDARVCVPTTLNVSSLDLLHPDLYKGDPDTAARARDLMDAHVELGCTPSWTCAPYQLPSRPGFGDQIAWGESNAIVFANSVLGARTNRYGDFADLACAITGRAPYSGLHTDAGRRADLIVDLIGIPDDWLGEELFYPILGYWLGAHCGTGIPALVGLDSRADEDRLKAMGAAAASSGATAMFHVVGVTPEAPDLDAVASPDLTKIDVAPSDLIAARAKLGLAIGPIGAVSVGTPHLSIEELGRLASEVEGRHAIVPFYANTARASLDSLSPAQLAALESFGVTIVTDTCTYVTPIMGEPDGPVMTNSAKWAYYAPGNLGFDVVFAGLRECIDSAESGQVAIADPFLP